MMRISNMCSTGRNGKKEMLCLPSLDHIAILPACWGIDLPYERSVSRRFATSSALIQGAVRSLWSFSLKGEGRLALARLLFWYFSHSFRPFPSDSSRTHDPAQMMASPGCGKPRGEMSVRYTHTPRPTRTEPHRTPVRLQRVFNMYRHGPATRTWEDRGIVNYFLFAGLEVHSEQTRQKSLRYYKLQ